MSFISNIQVLIQAPVFNLSLIIDGILIGSIFALAGYGLALVWGVMNVKNLAQGDFVMMGGYVALMVAHAKLHPMFAVPLAFVLMWGFGWVIFHLIIKRVINRDLFTSLLATFGMAIVIQQGLNLIFSANAESVDSGFGSFQFFGGMVTIPVARFVACVMAAILATGMIIFMKNSRMGQAIRATAQDPRAARVLGVDTQKVYAFTFSLNAAICGAAGALAAMIWVIHPFLGIIYSIRAFVLVTAAGLGNLPGVIVAGLGMGVIEQYGGFILGAEFQQAIVVLMLVAVLIVRQIQRRRHRQVVQ